MLQHLAIFAFRRRLALTQSYNLIAYLLRRESFTLFICTRWHCAARQVWCGVESGTSVEGCERLHKTPAAGSRRVFIPSSTAAQPHQLQVCPGRTRLVITYCMDPP